MPNPMPRALSVSGHGHWTGTVVDSVVLDFDDRHRRRIVLQGVGGLSFLLDLPEALALRGGDVLHLEDGRLVEVVAAPEDLAEIRCHDQQALVRMAWHLGNRHLPTQILAKSLRIRRDHVIEDMARGLGAKVVEIEAPFDPEGGAYVSHAPAKDASHDHDHHSHDHHDHHDHAQKHDDHSHDHSGHVHDHTCNHDHSH